MNSGSGIYGGKQGRLVGSIYETPTTKLFKAIVPKHNSSYQMPPKEDSTFIPTLETSRLKKLTTLRDYNVDIFETLLLSEDFHVINSTNLCHGQLCCTFSLNRKSVMNSSAHSAYRYRLAVYDGADDKGKTTFQRVEPSAIAICAVFACTSEDLISCGHIFPGDILVGNKYYFDQIYISGDFQKSKRYLIMPSTLDGSMMPLSALGGFTMETIEGLVIIIKVLTNKNFKFFFRKNKINVEMRLAAPKNDLLTFGIYVNYFSERESKHNYYKNPSTYRVEKSSARMNSIGLVIWFLIYIRMVVS